MKKGLTWRLSRLPTVEELQQLVNDKILTKEEAKQVLFRDEEATDIKALQSENEFLKKLVEKLSDSPSKIIETIRYIEKPYVPQPWFVPYQTWCVSNSDITTLCKSDIISSATGGNLGVSSTANFASI